MACTGHIIYNTHVLVGVRWCLSYKREQIRKEMPYTVCQDAFTVTAVLTESCKSACASLSLTFSPRELQSGLSETFFQISFWAGLTPCSCNLCLDSGSSSFPSRPFPTSSKVI